VSERIGALDCDEAFNGDRPLLADS
jgi:hypothetical protein